MNSQRIIPVTWVTNKSVNNMYLAPKIEKMPIFNTEIRDQLIEMLGTKHSSYRDIY